MVLAIRVSQMGFPNSEQPTTCSDPALGAPASADVTGRPRTQCSSLWRILGPSSIVCGEAFIFSTSLGTKVKLRH